MNLFDIIPENLFSILASKNKRIYIDALFVIRECFKQEMAIPKEEVATLLISKLEDEIINIEVEEGDTDEPEEKLGNNISAKAHYILRRLKETGWIEEEIQEKNFREDIILPFHTIDIVNLLHSLTTKRNTEYNAYAYATYSVLKVAVEGEEQKQLYNAVITAYENSNKLVNSLKSLYQNLGRYYRKIIGLEEVNEILEEHFDNYKQYIDSIYHPLKTDDPVDMYKVPISKMIDKIIGRNDLFEELMEQTMKTGNYENEEDAKNDILTKLYEIQEIYQNINKKITEVDNKNREYVKATNRRIGYLLTNSKETKGKIINILKNAKNQKVLEKMKENTSLLKQSYIDKDSIYLRSNKSDKKQGKPQPVEEVKIESEEELKKFIEKVGNSYTSQKVNDYMKNLMKDLPIITTNDIEIKSEEDFILLMLGTMKEERNFYKIEYENRYIKKGRYTIPEMTITKKNKQS